MKTYAEKSPAVLLFNPSVYVAGAKALLLGLAAILVASLIGTVNNTHFDGVLDTHTGASFPRWFFLAEGITDWLCLAIVLLLAGRIISPTSFRTIDLLGTQALARWPSIFIAMAMLPAGVQRFIKSLVEQITKGKTQFHAADAALFAVAMGILLLCIVWMVRLMYKSFSVSCNVRGFKAIGTFIAGLLLAEVLSKWAIYGLVVATIGVPPAMPPQTQRVPGTAGDCLILRGDSDQRTVTNNRVVGHTTTSHSILAPANRESSLAIHWQDANNGSIAVNVPVGAPGAGNVSHSRFYDTRPNQPT